MELRSQLPPHVTAGADAGGVGVAQRHVVLPARTGRCSQPGDEREHCRQSEGRQYDCRRTDALPDGVRFLCASQPTLATYPEHVFDTLSDRLSAVFTNLRGKGRLSEADIDATAREIRIALLEADVALPVVRSSSPRSRSARAARRSARR